MTANQEMPLPDSVSQGLSRPESQTLAEALGRCDLQLDNGVVDRLDAYRAALWRWNEQLNLTRHTTFDKFAARDVVDSMQLAELLTSGERVLDMGTGGGVPGLVLAICRPDLRVRVCESTQKKARAVQAIVTELQMPVTVHACRAEDVLELQTFDTLVARAVASVSKLLTWLEPHWGAFDQLLLIKGRSWVDERGDARHRGLLKSLELRKAVTYTMPGTGGESVILKIRRS
jgi:16S rRNA (guanine527-N7)-methyltransferase